MQIRSQPEPLVAIGSSAGGLEAMMRLLPHLRANGRSRYVVAQHMAKTGHNDLVLRVLARTSSLPIVQGQNDELLLPDRIYVVPSNWNGVVKAGKLQLLEPASTQLSTPSVNELFKSIAEAAGSTAVGIILSGAGADGLHGCQAIKAGGGAIFIQTPETALITGMLGAVQRAGLADAVLSPEDLAQRINDLVPAPTAARAPSVAVPAESHPSGLQGLVQKVSSASGINFSSYKEDTLVRRIRGRMKTLGISELEDYAARASEDPGELDRLKKLFVVSLSWFFRDRPVFDELQKLLMTAVAKKTGQEPVRVWVPGCATGEECFSFAILLTELLQNYAPRARIEIIGSDVNAEALEVARGATYSIKAFKEFQDPDLTARYFSAAPGGHQVAEPIRALCTFRQEDVIAAAPPTGLDLISCRNLLIYMKSDLQEKMIEKFFRALKPDGLLLLGMSENIGLAGTARFSAIDSGLRIFRRKTSPAENIS
jgi:chemotaxis methyl-accepting protein methylase